MRVKTSVTLSGDLLAEIDRLDDNRSAFLERAARQAGRDARDVAIIERNVKRLNQDALDVLEYQGLPE